MAYQILEDIRSYVYDHVPEVGPFYNFSTDRQHCLMANISDQAPPYAGFWRLELGQIDPQILFPVAQWDASDVPVVYLRAAYHCQNDQAEIFFAGQDGVFTGAKRLAFTIIPDGEGHTYELDFASHPEYTGIITRLRFDPLQACASGVVHSVGTHEIVWNGRDSFGRQVASGAYFYQLRSLNVTQTMKMTLVQ